MAKKTDGRKVMSKSKFCNILAEASGLPRKHVALMYDELILLLKQELGEKGPGEFELPGIVKFYRVQRPGKAAGVRANPFKPGEVMRVKATPPKKFVRAKVLKVLRRIYPPAPQV